MQSMWWGVMRGKPFVRLQGSAIISYNAFDTHSCSLSDSQLHLPSYSHSAEMSQHFQPSALQILLPKHNLFPTETSSRQHTNKTVLLQQHVCHLFVIWIFVRVGVKLEMCVMSWNKCLFALLNMAGFWKPEESSKSSPTNKLLSSCCIAHFWGLGLWNPFHLQQSPV